jgi:hypothetical protein
MVFGRHHPSCPESSKVVAVGIVSDTLARKVIGWCWVLVDHSKATWENELYFGADADGMNENLLSTWGRQL